MPFQDKSATKIGGGMLILAIMRGPVILQWKYELAGTVSLNHRIPPRHALIIKPLFSRFFYFAWLTCHSRLSILTSISYFKSVHSMLVGDKK